MSAQMSAKQWLGSDMNANLTKVAENAAGFTYSAAGSTIIIWGLHISEIAAIVSTICAVCGLSLQVYVVLIRRKANK
jgi:hypothetical protein